MEKLLCFGSVAALFVDLVFKKRQRQRNMQSGCLLGKNVNSVVLQLHKWEETELTEETVLVMVFEYIKFIGVNSMILC